MMGSIHSETTRAGVQEVTTFRSNALIPVIASSLATTYITVLLRIFTRKKFAKLWWDDFTIVISLVFFSAFCGSTLSMLIVSRGAAGIQGIPSHHTELAVKFLLMSECFYILTMISLKLSLAIFFLRVLPTQWQRWLIIGVVSTSTAFGIGYFFFAIFQCGWFNTIKFFIVRLIAGRCASKPVGMAINYTYALLGTISDWTCMLIPIYILRECNMPRRSKCIVCGLFAFASIGSIASVVRMVYLHNITVPTGNFFRNISKLAIWSTIEPGVGITVTSLATLRRLFQCIFKDSKFFGPRLRRNSFALAAIAYTTPIIQERKTEPGTGTNLGSETTVTASPSVDNGRAVLSERRMAEEMRCYGMQDFDDCATVRHVDLKQYVDRDFERGSSICGSQSISIQARTDVAGDIWHWQRRLVDQPLRWQFSVDEETRPTSVGPSPYVHAIR